MSSSKEYQGLNASLRTLLGEIKMPKEMLAAMLSQADKTKKEIVNGIMHELKSAMFEKKAVEILRAVLAEMEFDIHVKIKLNQKKRLKKKGA